MAKMRIGTFGLPTEIDVKKLMDHFGVPERGTSIKLAEIAEVLGLEPGSSRFTSILGAYRSRLLKPHNLVTVSVDADHLDVLTEEARVLFDQRKAGGALKRERAVARDLAMVEMDKIDDQNTRKLRDDLLGFVADHFKLGAKQYNALLPPAAPKALPRRTV